ncbi:MBL fold metallo-hydrolase [Aeromicrobium tamlense]|uniref:Glyoxylase-like metal-dependent hydrolase (Beta-lactamase superfamily II) n=1 Tax=Aeromicrobium tamlense TaxID=375541 RepID=A0A8I0FWV9_9ACTN|nr:MBL fold metallo-hydrolase [Aeromicrobium tamlense]MBD1272147.1 MBL fold metallo-hydrolase [Aeromicrobium tamlense]NYI38658.1 glyoxylase-like metal-dependent hydrolase (beta-lactamase superfamily II) [Aeromicrobium tamlense]
MEVTEVADGIWFARTEYVNWIVLVEGDRAALVDCGYPGQAGLLEESVRRAGVTMEQVEALVVTHNHVDHTGSMPALSARGVRVLAGADEMPMLRGERVESATTTDVLLRAWRPRVLRWALGIARLGASGHPHVDTVEAVVPGQPLDLPCSPVPVSLPGHTSGHIALHFPAQRAVATGDALVTGHSLSPVEGPQAIDAFFHHDTSRLRATLPDLALLDADLVLPGHGPAAHVPIARAVGEALSV